VTLNATLRAVAQQLDALSGAVQSVTGTERGSDTKLGIRSLYCPCVYLLLWYAF
jgi:hypothetical protein